MYCPSGESTTRLFEAGNVLLSNCLINLNTAWSQKFLELQLLVDGVVLPAEPCGNWPPSVSLCRHKVYEKQALRLGPQLTMWFTTDQEEEEEDH